MRYRYLTADVFTDRVFGGNPLAVLPEAEGLDGDRMQAIAREFNLSETVFILPPEQPDHARRVRIFTPAVELPFAGHPTVGAAFVLATIGALDDAPDQTILLEEGVGTVPVRIRERAGEPLFCELTTAAAPEVGPSPPAEVIAPVLGLAAEDIRDDDLTPRAVSCGVPYLCVPLVDGDAVRRARLDRARFDEALADSWAPLVYMFAAGSEAPGADIHARMFGIAVGVEEDPATGSAAASLAAYLAMAAPERDGTLRWVIEQGTEIGRPSRISVAADLVDGAVAAVRVGGPSVLVTEGTIDVG